MKTAYKSNTAERIVAKSSDVRCASGLYKATSRPTPLGQMLVAVDRYSVTYQVEQLVGRWANPC